MTANSAMLYCLCPFICHIVLVLLRLHTSPSQRPSMHEWLPRPALAVTLVQTLGHTKPKCLLRPGSVDTSPLVCIVHPYLQSTFCLVSFLHARTALTPNIYTEQLVATPGKCLHELYFCKIYQRISLNSWLTSFLPIWVRLSATTVP